MATCTLADGRYVTTNASTYASNAFTPAVGDLLVAIFHISGTTNSTPTCSSTGGYTGTWTRLDVVQHTTAGNPGRKSVFISDGFVSAASSTTVTCDTTADAGTSCGSHVWRVAGMSKSGTQAKKQSAQQDNHAAGTPFVTFAVALTTTNPTILQVGDEGAAVGYTPPTGWTEPSSPAGEGNWSTPTARVEGCFRDSGSTATTVTWGTASTGVYGSYGIELDASAAAAAERPPIFVSQYSGRW